MHLPTWVPHAFISCSVAVLNQGTKTNFCFFFITLGLELSDTKTSTSLTYEPSLELLLITAKQLFLNRELTKTTPGMLLYLFIKVHFKPRCVALKCVSLIACEYDANKYVVRM